MEKVTKTQKTSGKTAVLKANEKKEKKTTSKTTANTDSRRKVVDNETVKTDVKKMTKNETKTAKNTTKTADFEGIEIDGKNKNQKSEIRRLKKIFKDLPESQKILTGQLVVRAAYLTSKLEEAEKLLDEEGMITNFENGEQVIQRVNPRLKSYMDLLKIYNALIEQIEDMIRHDRDIAKKENRGAGDDDPLMRFIKAR